MYHVAICDDDMLVRMLIRTAVERSGAECLISEFADGADLIDGYKGYDVLFLDIDMPETDGLEAAAVIRRTDRAVRIIYVTGGADGSIWLCCPAQELYREPLPCKVNQRI